GRRCAPSLPSLGTVPCGTRRAVATFFSARGQQEQPMIRTLLMSAGALALVSCGQQAAKNETAQQQAPATQTPAAPAAPAAPAQAAMTDAEFAQTVAKSDAFEI